MLQRFVDSCLKHPWRNLALWGVVLAGLGYLTYDLRPGLSIEDFYPPEARQSLREQERLTEAFGGANRIVVVLESPRPFDAAVAAKILDPVADELRRLPGVGRVDYKLDDQLRRFVEEQLPHQLLLHLTTQQLEQLRQSITPQAIRAGLQRAQREPLAPARKDPLSLYGIVSDVWTKLGVQGPLRIDAGVLADPALKRRFMVIEPKGDLVAFDNAESLVNAIDAVVARASYAERGFMAAQRLKLSAVGRPAIYVEAYRTLNADARSSLLLSFLLVYLMAVLFFRRPFFSLLAGVPIIVSTAVTLWLGEALFHQVHLLTLVFCALLVGLGDDFSLHIASHFWLLPALDGERRAQSKRERLLYAIRKPFSGILFSALTMMAAFLSLIICGYPVVRITGLLIAAGIGCVLITSTLFMPQLLAVWPKGAPLEPVFARFWGGVTRGLARLHGAKRRGGIIFWCVLLVIAAAGLPQLRFESHPWSVMVRGNARAASMDKLHRALGVSFTPLLLVSKGATRQEALQRDRAAFERVYKAKDRSRIAAIQSLSALLPEPQMQKEALQYIAAHKQELSSRRFLADYARALRQLRVPYSDYLHKTYPQLVARALDASSQPMDLNALEKLGLEHELNRYSRQVDGLWYSVTYLYPQRFPWLKGALDPFMRQWQKIAPNLHGDTRLVGEALRALDHQKNLRRDAIRVTLLALLLIGAVLYALFRSGKLLVKIFVPLFCSSVVVLGLMGFMGIELNFMTMAVLPILFGIGVNNGIHIIERFRRGESTRQVLHEVGPGMIIATLSTVTAFFTFLLARYEAVRDFGLCGGVGVLVSLAASLHLLPLLNRRDAKR